MAVIVLAAVLLVALGAVAVEAVLTRPVQIGATRQRRTR